MAIRLATPPPEPDRRISRIRLSRQWSDSVLANVHRISGRERRPTARLSFSFFSSRGKRPLSAGAGGFVPWRDQPSRALRQSLLSCSWTRLLPRPCLPLLHGRYPASWLLRRLCHLPGTALRAAAGHELRRCSRIVIPDSRHDPFQPFCLQPPSAFHAAADTVFVQQWSPESPRPWAGHPVLDFVFSPADSSMQMAESSSAFSCLRTGCSLPVAPHPVSRRRSCLQLRASSVRPGENFHLSGFVRFQAHWSRRFVGWQDGRMRRDGADAGAHRSSARSRKGVRHGPTNRRPHITSRPPSVAGFAEGNRGYLPAIYFTRSTQRLL